MVADPGLCDGIVHAGGQLAAFIYGKQRIGRGAGAISALKVPIIGLDVTAAVNGQMAIVGDIHTLAPGGSSVNNRIEVTGLTDKDWQTWRLFRVIRRPVADIEPITAGTFPITVGKGRASHSS